METGARTLFDEAIERISAAIEAHRDEPGWRDIIERTSGNRGSTTFVVAVHEPGTTRSESYVIRVCRGRFEVVAPAFREARPDWRVSRDELRALCAAGEPRDDGPHAFPLAWLARRLRIEGDGPHA